MTNCMALLYQAMTPSYSNLFDANEHFYLAHPTTNQTAVAFVQAAYPQKPILSALHLQGPKIHYIHSLLPSEQAIDWDIILEVKLSIKHVINLEIKNITRSSLNIGDLIICVTYHLKGSLSF